MKNKSIVFILLLLMYSAGFSQDAERFAKIQTDEGKEYSGKIISENSTQIVIEDGSTQITVLKTQISNIQYYNSLKELRTTKQSFSFLGLTILQPGGINLVAGREFGRFGARIAAGYIGAAAGIQANFLVNLSRSKSFNHHVSLGAGTSYIDTPDSYYGSSYTIHRTWQYIGGFYDLNYSGFFLETGLEVGSGSFSNPQLALQIGYVYEFR